jgi:poly(A) polymerase Pap1
MSPLILDSTKEDNTEEENQVEQKEKKFKKKQVNQKEKEKQKNLKVQKDLNKIFKNFKLNILLLVAHSFPKLSSCQHEF